jgi:HEPN domain-containing protein
MVGKEIARLQELETAALELDLHYIPSRYPNGLPSGYPHIFYGRETAERALRHAEHLFEAVVAYYRERGDTAIFSEEDEGPG